MSSLENLVICSGFFIITLIIMMVIYYKIHKDIKLSRLKTVAEKYRSEVENYGLVLDQKKKEIDSKFVEVSNQTFEMMKEIKTQLSEVNSYNEDFVKLQEAMVTYHEALNRLSQMTVKVEKETDLIKVKAEALEVVENKINKIDVKASELEALLNLLNKQMDENAEMVLNKQQEMSNDLLKNNVDKLNSSFEKISIASQTYMLNLEKQIKLTQQATLALTDKAGPILVEYADRYAMLANEQTELRKLKNEKEDLSKQLKALKEEKDLLDSLILKGMGPEDIDPEIQKKSNENPPLIDTEELIEKKEENLEESEVEEDIPLD